MKTKIALFFPLLIGWALLAPLAGQAQEKPAPIYDPQADIQAMIAAALPKAAAENKHVLLMFGANWCPWCHRLHGLFRSDPAVAARLAGDFILILIDIGKTRDMPLNRDLEERYRVKGFGYPCLAVLDAKGTLLAAQSSGVLEKGKAHDPQRVLGFLAANAPQPR